MPNPGAVYEPVRDLAEETAATLRYLLPPPSPVALLDFPAHTNAGDSLIYLGQRRILRELGYQVAYLADTRVYSAAALRRRHPSGPIFLQGGGNLGDRWLHTQQFREQVIRDFPDRTIVQLPQSIDFHDPARAATARQVFARHPDLLVLMRDQRSLTRARDVFADTRIEYCPDLAIGYGPVHRPVAPEYDVVLLMREDTESSRDGGVELPAGASSMRTDWGFSGIGRLPWQLRMLPSAAARHVVPLRLPLQTTVEASFDELAAFNVRAASAILARGRIVVTDRLHAAVLAALLGIPVIALDNANRKISAAYDAYLHRLPHLRFAVDGQQASELAHALLRQDA